MISCKSATTRYQLFMAWMKQDTICFATPVSISLLLVVGLARKICIDLEPLEEP